MNSLYDAADILATSKYLPEKTQTEPSYADKSISPKNKAHENVKYWYKFQNEIVFDGVPYTVTFSIRDKGKEQYQYLIDFKENKTLGLSNTVFKKSENLLRADQASDTIIRNSAEKSTGKFSLSPIAPEIAPDGNFKITSEDVTLKTPEVQRKAESDLGDIPIRDDIKKLPPEDIAPPVEGTTNKINYQNYTDEDFSANAKALVSMESVKDLTGNEFKKEGNTTLKEKVMSFFNRFGNKVHSQRFGDVDLTLSSFRSEAAHGWTRGKIISFEAIPEVIQNGVVIDSQRRGNGNYDRIVVAAPITIAGQEYYMGVMLQRDNKSQRLYLHDVITKEKASIHESEHLSSNRVADETDSLFMTSILQKAVLVNSKSTQDSEDIFPVEQKSKKPSVKETKNESDLGDIPIRDDIAPPITQTSSDGDVFFDGASKTKERSWVKTATESDVVDNKILADATVNKVLKRKKDKAICFTLFYFYFNLKIYSPHFELFSIAVISEKSNIHSISDGTFTLYSKTPLLFVHATLILPKGES